MTPLSYIRSETTTLSSHRPRFDPKWTREREEKTFRVLGWIHGKTVTSTMTHLKSQRKVISRSTKCTIGLALMATYLELSYQASLSCWNSWSIRILYSLPPTHPIWKETMDAIASDDVSSVYNLLNQKKITLSTSLDDVYPSLFTVSCLFFHLVRDDTRTSLQLYI